jgi:hypothetical protein
VSDEKRKRGGKAPPKETPATPGLDESAEAIGNREGRRADAEVRKLQALPYLVAGMGHAEVAKIVGVSAWTVGDWLKNDPDFKRALLDQARASEEVVAELRAALRAGGGKAIANVLAKVFEGDTELSKWLLTQLGVGEPKRLEHGLGQGADELLMKVAAILAKRNAREAGGDENASDESAGETDETEGGHEG